MISEALPIISVSLRIFPTLPSIIGSLTKKKIKKKKRSIRIVLSLIEPKKKATKERTNQQSLLRTINHAHGLYFVSTSIELTLFSIKFVLSTFFTSKMFFL